MSTSHYIIPDWPAPSTVSAAVTTRQQGVSRSPYDSFNLATHVGDQPESVASNRNLLRQQLHLPDEPLWLNQVHGRCIARHDGAANEPEADGSYSDQAGQVCVVMTADCLPVLLCNQAGTEVAAVHAGWRGLAGGIIADAVHGFASPPGELLAWLGPAIGPEKFEVGQEVYEAFVTANPAAADGFRAVDESHWLADLYYLARLQLNQLEVSQVYGGDYCTMTDTERFYSFRRDGVTGRMAALIWLEN
ncbi:MAG: laccase [Acidithiobacillales bacterium SG8_45]|nr:MAG: laccase [Acidithiobacillales bacterium SG8_45]